MTNETTKNCAIPALARLAKVNELCALQAGVTSISGPGGSGGTIENIIKVGNPMNSPSFGFHRNFGLYRHFNFYRHFGLYLHFVFYRHILTIWNKSLRDIWTNRTTSNCC